MVQVPWWRLLISGQRLGSLLRRALIITRSNCCVSRPCCCSPRVVDMLVPQDNPSDVASHSIASPCLSSGSWIICISFSRGFVQDWFRLHVIIVEFRGSSQTGELAIRYDSLFCILLIISLIIGEYTDAFNVFLGGLNLSRTWKKYLLLSRSQSAAPPLTTTSQMSQHNRLVCQSRLWLPQFCLSFRHDLPLHSRHCHRLYI